MANMAEKNTSWGHVSSWYNAVVEHPESYQQSVILPNITRIVASKKGMRILDVGCGTGVFARVFSEAGAEVVGVDLGKELIAIAKEKSSHIRYYVGSADNLSAVTETSFDVVTIVLALQNMKKMDVVFEEIAKKLKKNGRIVLVLNHPSFRVPQWSDWGFDEVKKMQYRKVARYMSEIEIPILMNPGKKNSEKTFSFHRPLQLYVKSLAKQKCAITKLEEWISHKESQKGPRKGAEDVARKEIPLFMCIEATKL